MLTSISIGQAAKSVLVDIIAVISRVWQQYNKVKTLLRKHWYKRARAFVQKCSVYNFFLMYAKVYTIEIVCRYITQFHDDRNSTRETFLGVMIPYVESTCRTSIPRRHEICLYREGNSRKTRFSLSDSTADLGVSRRRETWEDSGFIRIRFPVGMV